MDNMIYVAMSGARQVMLKQASNNHNLANANTSGFKAQIDNFRSLPVHGPGHPGRVYGQLERSGIDHGAGALRSTGNPMDIAVQGNGFIAVLDEQGNEAYTRDGHLRLTPSGMLETASGYPVLGDGGPITLSPFEKMQIGSDGTITIQPLGQGAGELAVIDRIKLVNPDRETIIRDRQGLFQTDLDIEPADGDVMLATESLEDSNVNSVEALVNMIELSRRYETQVKLMKVAEENDTAAGKLLSGS